MIETCDLCSSCDRALIGLCGIPTDESEELFELKKQEEVFTDKSTCDMYKHKTNLMKFKDYINMKVYGFKMTYYNTRSFFRNNLYGRIKYGFNIEDTWNLDANIAKYAAPRIKYLSKKVQGYPGMLDDDDYLMDNSLIAYADKNPLVTWKNILEYMANGFNSISGDNFDEENQEDIQKETLRLFTLFYFNLWD